MNDIRVHHTRKKYRQIKRTITFLVLLFTYAKVTWAYDFSSVAPSGQTLYYTINDSTTVSVTSGDEPPVGALTIPSSVTHNGQTYWVTAIDRNAFSYSYRLITATIPNTVTTIGDRAFHLCSRLTTVIIPDSVTSIGSYAFEYCEALTSITIPNTVTTIGNYAFAACRSLTSVTIPNSVTTIGDDTFVGCSGLTTVTIPNTVTTIGNYAFSQCNSLTTVTIPNSVTSIGNYAFSQCNSLTTVTIPNSVTTIGDRAFSTCLNLTTVTIPNSVTSIGDYAFYNNISRSLHTVIMGCTTPPQIQEHTFYSSANHPITFHIPCNTTLTYTNASIWNHFNNHYEEDIGCPALVIVTSSDTTLGTVSGSGIYENGQTVALTATPMPHCHFVAWEDGNSQNPRTITIDSTDVYLIYTAIFAEDPYYIVTVATNGPYLGSVTGSGIYQERDTAILIAIPLYDCRFVQWNDGDSTNPRAINVMSDTNLMAIFGINPDTIIIRDTSITRDTTYVSVHDTIEIHDTVSRCFTYYELIVLSDNLQCGVVAGNGRFPDSTRVEISAIPIEGYRFEQWHDGNSDNPRVIQIKGGDATYVAAFEPSTQTIGSIETDKEVAISTHDGQITVTNVGKRTIRLFDSAGRQLTTSNTQEDTRHITPPTSGVYLLQVGTAPARRVVVVK